MLTVKEPSSNQVFLTHEHDWILFHQFKSEVRFLGIPNGLQLSIIKFHMPTLGALFWNLIYYGLCGKMRLRLKRNVRKQECASILRWNFSPHLSKAYWILNFSHFNLNDLLCIMGWPQHSIYRTMKGWHTYPIAHQKNTQRTGLSFYFIGVNHFELLRKYGRYSDEPINMWLRLSWELVKGVS